MKTSGTVRFFIEAGRLRTHRNFTVWMISMYGGVVLSEDHQNAGRDAKSGTVWWVFTGPPELGQTFASLR
jgi:hypothetical protein